LIFSCLVQLAWLHSAAQSADSAWQQIKPYFSPPESFADKYGEFRSPLRFYDRRQVKTSADWRERRQEILDRWHGIMGKWPPLIEKPQFRFVDSVRKDNYTEYKVSFEWRKGELSSGYLLVPDGPKRKAAVLIVFYEPETALGLGKEPYRDMAVQLARRGIVAFSTGAQPVADRKPYAQYYPSFENARLQPLSMLAYLAANAWNALAALPFVDSSRIGVTGHSYGGKWAMFASCLFEKFACAAWSDNGIVFDESRVNVNYQDPWYLGYYQPPWGPANGAADTVTYRKTQWGMAGRRDKGAYAVLRRDGHDLHELHALMAPRPFLVSGGSEDPPERWLALNHAVAVNKLLGYKDRVGMTNRPQHAPDELSRNQVCMFFEHFLKEDALK